MTTHALRLRSWLEARRTHQQRIETQARAELASDENAQRVTGGRNRRQQSLGDAWKAFWSHPSPFVLAAAFVIALVGRLAVGDFRSRDLLVPLVLVAVFPVVEWLIHVLILHYRPREVAGKLLDMRLARDHRAHHSDPRDLPLVFIPYQTYYWLLPSLAAIGLLAFPRLSVGLTFLVSLTILGFAYEWTHYLIHTDYKPKTAAYRAVWRNHRLHHYKNERYWFTVTSAGTADRLLRTYPDPAEVETSPTARSLHGLG